MLVSLSKNRANVEAAGKSVKFAANRRVPIAAVLDKRLFQRFSTNNSAAQEMHLSGEGKVTGRER